MMFCYYRSNDFAIGKPEILRNLISEINSKYNIIKKMIELKIKVVDNDSKCKSRKCISYSELLYNIFRYDKFGTIDSNKLIRKNSSMDDTKMNELVIKIRKDNEGLKKTSIERLLNLIHNIWDIEEKTIENRIINKSFLGFWGAYAYSYMIDLRVCPYCNRQYITPVLTQNGMMRGDMDHFLPKSKYPYLSLSIYNLIPVCRFCNSSFKGDKEFELTDLYPFEESLDDYIKFNIDIVNNKKVNIKVKKYNNSNKVDRYLDMFRIEDQYNYHINQAEELIHKKIIYSKEHVNEIRKIFKKHNISDVRINEILIGYTSDKTKINNETLSKLKRDLVNQLELNIINKENDKIDGELLGKLKNLI